MSSVLDLLSPPTKGTLFGLAAVLAWAAYNAGVATARANGFSVADLTMLRHFGATIAFTCQIGAGNAQSHRCRCRWKAPASIEGTLCVIKVLPNWRNTLTWIFRRSARNQAEQHASLFAPVGLKSCAALRLHS